MRILRWFYDMLFSMLIAGVYSIKPMIAPTLEDIKNKLRSSAGIGVYGIGKKIARRYLPRSSRNSGIQEKKEFS